MTSRIISQLNAGLRLFGLDVPKMVRSTAALPIYVRDHGKLRKALRDSDTPFEISRLTPCLLDRTDKSGAATGAYFLQDLEVAGMIFNNQPEKHVDVGSSVAGFVAHVASFREIEVFDIRPLSTQAPNIIFRQSDFMADNVGYENYADSLSCLHTIEHFGLGRYGDRIDPNGHIIGINNLHKVLKPGGTLYFSTPIGPQRIEFNAHRVFSLTYLLSLLEPRFTIKSFSYVNDSGELIRNAKLVPESIESNFGCRYGVGIFMMKKNP